MEFRVKKNKTFFCSFQFLVFLQEKKLSAKFIINWAGLDPNQAPAAEIAWMYVVDFIAGQDYSESYCFDQMWAKYSFLGDATDSSGNGNDMEVVGGQWLTDDTVTEVEDCGGVGTSFSYFLLW